MSTATQDTVGTKLERQFDALDLDQDGFLSYADYEKFGQRYIEAYGIDKHDRRARALLVSVQVQWLELLRHANAETDRLSKEQYVAAARLAMADTSRFHLIEGSGHAIFDVIDMDGDNEIGRSEFERFLRDVWRSEAPDAMDSFAALDSDGDGAISRMEFIRSVREHYLSDDPSAPGSLFFGQAQV
ncbi:EF-hand domain-containing protein [Streptomyces albidoflavus]